MRSTILLCLLLAVGPLLATNHTLCWNMFMKKDHCVFSNPGPDKRCGADGKPPTKPVTTFVPHHHKQHAKRYDHYFPVQQMKGLGVCDQSKNDPNYITYNAATVGACLWVGPDWHDVKKAGWLNYAKTSNCGKQVYIGRHLDPTKKWSIPIVDACSFGITPGDLVSGIVDKGCYQIGLTSAAWELLNPTPKERAMGQMLGLFWDFDNFSGNSSDFGPV